MLLQTATVPSMFLCNQTWCTFPKSCVVLRKGVKKLLMSHTQGTSFVSVMYGTFLIRLETSLKTRRYFVNAASCKILLKGL